MARRVACIDVGSNTTRLLVAELRADGTVRPVLEERSFSQPTTAEHLHALVRGHLTGAQAAGARRVRVVGTAMLRSRPDLAAALDDDLEVLDPGEEARLAYVGATQGAPAGSEVAVLDIGGGSTELALGTVGGAIAWWASVPVGSRTLCDGCGLGDPPTPAQLAVAAREAVGAIAQLDCPRRPPLVLAAGGSATTTARLVGRDLEPEVLDRVLDALCSAPAADVGPDLGIDPRRAHVMPAGLLLLRAAREVLGAPVRLGAGGLREGVALELLADGG
ncbi:MAG TPA: hypothetical protein VD931_22425 [Baekduia sp.]|nr:hypothetical protein [Baekduia sp.]